MNDAWSDAFVFFEANGDLAYKKISPALQRVVKHGGLDQAALAKLSMLLRSVPGDYHDPEAFKALRPRGPCRGGLARGRSGSKRRVTRHPVRTWKLATEG